MALSKTKELQCKCGSTSFTIGFGGMANLPYIQCTNCNNFTFIAKVDLEELLINNSSFLRMGWKFKKFEENQWPKGMYELQEELID